MDSPLGALTVELGRQSGQEEALSVSFSLDPLPVSLPNPAPGGSAAYPPDPFFDGPVPAQPVSNDPFGLFDPIPAQGSSASLVNPELIHSRASAKTVRRLGTYQTRTLVLGLIRLLQRRSIIGQDELQHLLVNLLEAGEIKDDDKVG
jgi:hypothetical protein